jgi:hypothetical protein
MPPQIEEVKVSNKLIVQQSASKSLKDLTRQRLLGFFLKKYYSFYLRHHTSQSIPKLQPVSPNSHGKLQYSITMTTIVLIMPTPA